MGGSSSSSCSPLTGAQTVALLTSCRTQKCPSLPSVSDRKTPQGLKTMASQHQSRQACPTSADRGDWTRMTLRAGWLQGDREDWRDRVRPAPAQSHTLRPPQFGKLEKCSEPGLAKWCKPVESLRLATLQGDSFVLWQGGAWCDCHTVQNTGVCLCVKSSSVAEMGVASPHAPILSAAQR